MYLILLLFFPHAVGYVFSALPNILSFRTTELLFFYICILAGIGAVFWLDSLCRAVKRESVRKAVQWVGTAACATLIVADFWTLERGRYSPQKNPEHAGGVFAVQLYSVARGLDLTSYKRNWDYISSQP